MPDALLVIFWIKGPHPVLSLWENIFKWVEYGGRYLISQPLPVITPRTPTVRWNAKLSMTNVYESCLLVEVLPVVQLESDWMTVHCHFLSTDRSRSTSITPHTHFKLVLLSGSQTEGTSWTENSTRFCQNCDVSDRSTISFTCLSE